MKRETIVFESLEEARSFLRKLGINPLVAWNNSTHVQGIRQLHVGLLNGKNEVLIQPEDIDKVRFTRAGLQHYPKAVWMNVYFRSRSYNKK